jgi:hypothetical protein
LTGGEIEMVLNEITYFQILGFPLIIYLGILALVFFILTAVIAILNRRGNRIIPFEWHSRIAMIALLLAIIHGTLGVLNYF